MKPKIGDIKEVTKFAILLVTKDCKYLWFTKYIQCYEFREHYYIAGEALTAFREERWEKTYKKLI